MGLCHHYLEFVAWTAGNMLKNPSLSQNVLEQERNNIICFQALLSLEDLIQRMFLFNVRCKNISSLKISQIIYFPVGYVTECRVWMFKVGCFWDWQFFGNCPWREKYDWENPTGSLMGLFPSPLFFFSFFVFGNLVRENESCCQRDFPLLTQNVHVHM